MAESFSSFISIAPFLPDWLRHLSQKPVTCKCFVNSVYLPLFVRPQHVQCPNWITGKPFQVLSIELTAFTKHYALLPISFVHTYHACLCVPPTDRAMSIASRNERARSRIICRIVGQSAVTRVSRVT